jgi:hypothetical protein
MIILLKTLANLFLMALLVTIPVTVQGQTDQEYKEMQVKAAYLYNFTKFVYWTTQPDTREPASITIGLIQADKIASLLEDYIKTTSPGSGVIVKRINDVKADLTGCQLVYIDQSQKEHLAQILEPIKGNKILTVSDIFGFTRRGGMVGFYQEDGRIRIEINLSEVKNSGLEISAKLMEVARIVK